MRTRMISMGVAMMAPALFGGCDPIITIAGAMFPAWLFCALAGLLTALICRPLFAASGVERFMWPLVLVYPSIATIAATATWMIFFNRL